MFGVVCLKLTSNLQNSFSSCKNKTLYPSNNISLYSIPTPPGNHFFILSLWTWLLWILYISAIIHFSSHGNWLILLSIMSPCWRIHHHFLLYREGIRIDLPKTWGRVLIFNASSSDMMIFRETGDPDFIWTVYYSFTEVLPYKISFIKIVCKMYFHICVHNETITKVMMVNMSITHRVSTSPSIFSFSQSCPNFHLQVDIIVYILHRGNATGILVCLLNKCVNISLVICVCKRMTSNKDKQGFPMYQSCIVCKQMWVILLLFSQSLKKCCLK